MNILVINCSPKKKNSLTYRTSLFLEKYYKQKDTFKYIFAVDGKFPEENYEDFQNADLVVLCSSLYHYSIHAQMIHLFEDMERNLELKGKCMTYLTTSGYNFDQSSHRTVKTFAERNGFHFLESLSLADNSILPLRKECSLKEKFHGIEELYTWFGYTKDCAESYLTGTRKKFRDTPKVTILDSYETETEENKQAIATIRKKYEEYGGTVSVITLRDYRIKPCIGCSACYTNYKCFIEDEFEKAFNDVYADTDILVHTDEMKYGLYSYLHKIFLDRQVQYGRRNIVDEVIELFVLTGTYTQEEKDCFIEHEMGFQAMTGSVIAGYTSMEETEMQDGIYKTVAAYNNDVLPPTNYYTVSLNRGFARLAVQLQYLAPKDLEYYTKAGWLDEPEPLSFLKPLHSYEEAVVSQEVRAKPYDMVYKNLPDIVNQLDKWIKTW